MSTLTVFSFESHDIRTVMRSGEVWFVASDVCKALEYSNTSKAVGDHLDADERATHDVPTPNVPLGVPTNVISESGLYALVLRSRKPEARKFAKWVTRDVLPAIRKTGAYAIDERIDVAGLLLSGGSDLKVDLSPDLVEAVDARAWQLAGEAFGLIRQHLYRRIAYGCQYDYPERRTDVPAAMQVIAQGDLGYALAHSYHAELQKCASFLNIAQNGISEALRGIVPASQPTAHGGGHVRRVA